MGIINHNAVIATTFSESEKDKIKVWIDTLKETTITGRDPKTLFLFGEGIVNSYYTVVLIPDGSKEYWPDSEMGDKLRKQFIEKLKESNYSDGSSPWSWIEVGFGEYGQEIVQGNNENRY